MTSNKKDDNTPIITGKHRLFANMKKDDTNDKKDKKRKGKRAQHIDNKAVNMPKIDPAAFKLQHNSDDDSDDDIHKNDDDDAKVLDHWGLIQQLEWKDINEGKNKSKPSQVWTMQQYTLVKNSLPALYDSLKNKLGNDFFADHKMDNPDKFIYHIIAKGRIVYEGVLKDPIFAVAFIGEAGDFPTFMATWR